jgi:prolyl-tRNA synthetase
MGTIVENLSDDKGIVWPKSVAPFVVHLIEIGGDNLVVRQKAEALYNELNKAGVEVMWDDRAIRPGEKFADSDLFGLPLRLVVSEKLITAGEYEIKVRRNGETVMIPEKDLLSWIQKWE